MIKTCYSGDHLEFLICVKNVSCFIYTLGSIKSIVSKKNLLFIFPFASYVRNTGG
jgi:hypothetical protein